MNVMCLIKGGGGGGTLYLIFLQQLIYLIVFREGQLGSLQTPSLTCKSKVSLAVIIQNLVRPHECT